MVCDMCIACGRPRSDIRHRVWISSSEATGSDLSQARSSRKTDDSAASAHDFSILGTECAISINLNKFLIFNRKQKYMRKEIKKLTVTSKIVYHLL